MKTSSKVIKKFVSRQPNGYQDLGAQMTSLLELVEPNFFF